MAPDQVRTAPLVVEVTPRTYQIFVELLKDAPTNEQIARRLYLSPDTIKTMLYRLYKQTNVNSRTELVLRVARGELKIVVRGRSSRGGTS